MRNEEQEKFWRRTAEGSRG